MGSVSTIPDLSPPGDGVLSDKIWHVGEYAGWAILFRRGLDGSRSNATMWPLRMLVTLVVGCLLAVSDENLQRLVGRHYAVDDMVADAVGLVIGLLVYELIRSRLRATRQEEIQQTPGPSREGSTRIEKFQAPRGTQDIVSPAVEAWQSLEATARRVMALYGYAEVRTPIFE